MIKYWVVLFIFTSNYKIINTNNEFSTMNESELNLFLAVNGKYFSSNRLCQVKESLMKADNEGYRKVIDLPYIDPLTMFIISIVGGVFGLDRFLLGDTALGILKLVTAGGCGIWILIDWFTVKQRTEEYNFRLFTESKL